MFASRILPTIIFAAAATGLLTAQSVRSEAAAAACQARPGPSAPRGSHWYYRVDHASGRHCWFLGAMEAHARRHVARSDVTASVDAASKKNAAEAAPAAAPAASASPASAQDASAQSAAPEPATAFTSSIPAPGDQAGQMGFAARWPAYIPATENPDQAGLAAASDSYADTHGTTDAQALPRWPVKAPHASQTAAAGSVLHLLSLRGLFVLALLLLAGWAVKFTRRLDHGHLREQWWTLASRLLPGRQADAAQSTDMGFAIMTAPIPQIGVPGELPTPTDPADDLKTSLTELMGDLQRAGEARIRVRSFARPTRRSFKAAYRRTLQAAE